MKTLALTCALLITVAFALVTNAGASWVDHIEFCVSDGNCRFETLASSANYQYCVFDKQRDCWFDANREAREVMLDKMMPCFSTDDYPSCLFAVGWRKPVYEDPRFSQKFVFRK